MTEEPVDDGDEVERIIAEARAAWCSAMAQYTELSVAVYEEAFDLAVKLGTQRGRVQGVNEALAGVAALVEKMEAAHALDA